MSNTKTQWAELPLSEGDWVWSGNQLLAQKPGAMHSSPVLVAEAPFLPSDADACAISALPDLLRAAEACLSHLGPGGYIASCGEPNTRALQAAVAKARGLQKAEG